MPWRAWHWMNCFLPKNAKDSAKSAISIWEAKFSPNHDTTMTSPLNPFSTSKGKGDKRHTAWNLWTTSRAFSTLRVILYNPKIPTNMSSQFSKCRLGEEHGSIRRRAPSGPQWPGRQRRPRSHSQQDTVLSVQQDVLLWEAATGLQGLGDSFIRPCILHCLLENKLETSSKYNLSHNVKETNPFMLMPWEVYRLCTNKINPHKFWNPWWIHTWSKKKKN